MTDLDLKNSRKIIKLIGLPERPETSTLGHQLEGRITGVSNPLSHSLNVDLSAPEQGASFGFIYSAGFTFDEDGTNESVSAPSTGDWDAIFGVRGHETGARNWRGFLKVTEAATRILDLHTGRVPSSDMLVLFYDYTGAHNIVASDGSTVLASVSSPRGVRASACVGFSADGSSLAFGPKVYDFQASPTPPAASFVSSRSAKVSDAGILLTFISSYGSDTNPGVQPVVDLAGDDTETMPPWQNVNTAEFGEILFSVKLSATGVHNDYWATSEWPTGAEIGFYTAYNATMPGGLETFPRYGDMLPAIAKDGSFIVQPWWHVAAFDFHPSSVAIPEFGRNKTTPVVIGDVDGEHFRGNGSAAFMHGGIFKTKSDGEVDWVVSQTTDLDGDGVHPFTTNSRTTCADVVIDSSGNIYTVFFWWATRDRPLNLEFARWPTNYAGGNEAGAAFESSSVAMVTKLNSAGEFQWKKYVDFGPDALRSDSGSAEFNLARVMGIALSPDESEIYVTFKSQSGVSGSTSCRPIFDVGGTEWQTNADHTLYNDAHMFISSWATSDGTFGKARMLTHNTDPFGTREGFMRTGLGLSINPATGKVVFPVWIDISSTASTTNIAFWTDDGTTQTKVAAAPGVSLHTAGGSGGGVNDPEDSEIMYLMGWDPATGVVTVDRRILRAAPGVLDELYSFQATSVG